MNRQARNERRSGQLGGWRPPPRHAESGSGGGEFGHPVELGHPVTGWDVAASRWLPGPSPPAGPRARPTTRRSSSVTEVRVAGDPERTVGPGQQDVEGRAPRPPRPGKAAARRPVPDTATMTSNEHQRVVRGVQPGAPGDQCCGHGDRAEDRRQHHPGVAADHPLTPSVARLTLVMTSSVQLRDCSHPTTLTPPNPGGKAAFRNFTPRVRFFPGLVRRVRFRCYDFR